MTERASYRPYIDHSKAPNSSRAVVRMFALASDAQPQLYLRAIRAVPLQVLLGQTAEKLQLDTEDTPYELLAAQHLRTIFRRCIDLDFVYDSRTQRTVHKESDIVRQGRIIFDDEAIELNHNAAYHEARRQIVASYLGRLVKWSDEIPAALAENDHALQRAV